MGSNCPHCESPHVWTDPIGPAPKPFRWVCGTVGDERSDLCRALGLAECRGKLLTAAQADAERLASDVRIVNQLLYEAPELNPSNYDHDDVCLLNAKVCEAYPITKQAIAAHDALKGQPREQIGPPNRNGCGIS